MKGMMYARTDDFVTTIISWMHRWPNFLPMAIRFGRASGARAAGTEVSLVNNKVSSLFFLRWCLKLIN